MSEAHACISSGSFFLGDVLWFPRGTRTWVHVFRKVDYLSPRLFLIFIL